MTSQFIAEENQFRIRDVLTFDASVWYTYKQTKWQIHARNLTDRKYETRGFGSTSVIPGNPSELYCGFELNL
jgi:outer membrane receptor protein involved in Fe transport